MSLKVMTWAWTIRLPPAPKLVLMALADEADDRGFCFPSVRHLADKCNITERSVQRMIRVLVTQHCVSVERRFRRGRAQTSNGYQLAVSHPPTNCQGVPDTLVAGPVTPASGGGRRSGQGPGDTSVRVTTTYPCIYPSLQQPECNPLLDLAGPAVSGGGGDLCFPRNLSNAQQQALRQQLGGLNLENAQQILDELAGRMSTTHVRNPIRYCAVLAGRLEQGQFHPELAIRIADQRQAERQREAALREHTVATQAAVDMAIGRLPEPLRAPLERMRLKSPSQPTAGDSDGNLSSGASTPKEGD